MHHPKELAQSSVMIELNAELIHAKEEVHQNALKLSYECFMNLLFEGYEAFYLDEDDWKKIDQIEAFFKNHSSFSMDNRLFRQLERYTSAFLMFGGEKNEAIDRLLYAKLLRVAAINITQSDIHTNEDVLLLFEKLFGLEYLTKSKTLLKEIQENIKNLQ